MNFHLFSKGNKEIAKNHEKKQLLYKERDRSSIVSIGARWKWYTR